MKPLPLALAATLFASPLFAFTVTKNVNTGQLPTDKLIIFQKGQAAEKITFFDNANCRMSILADGTVESRITGGGEVKCGFTLPQPFNTKDYGYLVITCRLEGTNKITGPNGKTTDQARPDNLWFSASFFDAKGSPVGGANLADGSPDGKTPNQTVTIVLPMLLFTYFGDHDSSQVQGVGFSWPKSRVNISRDYHLIIEKVALAN
ncbi:hypothetical protein BH09VER1_BH09VER1_13110 [soil metagenome]